MRGMLGVVLLLVTGLCHAQGDLRMPVEGEIGVDPQGKVFDLNIESILTPEVKRVVDQAVRKWTFEPVMRNGVAVHAKAQMFLTLVAAPVEGGYQLRIERVHFAGDRPSETVLPPRYPRDAARAGIGADQLVAIRVDAGGKVREASVVQTSLPAMRGSEKELGKWRRLFEQATLAAARQWTFRASEDAANADDVTLIVPVGFCPPGAGNCMDDGWRYQSAGQQQPIPWLSQSEQQFDATGLRQGEAMALDNTLTLKTPVVGKSL
ncbi:hypothetical protein QLQ15_05295 [Lysobacter sp. LF1]|uniref:TonB C-terminal domain-containing protein n=1 Tax=Lysobacter stagni TaxID=3045172 RepID=A0ABT6XDV4_9GAMM|nr:hypothetical protein [Lysobacter sp. LF1]MDI9238326.1 hypothetical protein [Lysobacter sp. LF1]